MGFIATSDIPKTNAILNELAIQYPNSGFVANKVCPVVDVGEENESGNYYVFDKANLNKNIEDIRAMGARANSPEPWNQTIASYFAKEHSLELPIDRREFKQYKNREMDLGKSVTEFLLGLQSINYENRVATLLTATANYASSSYYSTLSGTSQWSDFVNSDPEAAIEVAREQVALNGAEPNTILMSASTWRKVRQHPQMRALIKTTDSKLLTDELMPPSLFGLELVVAGARNVTSLPGASETLARIWTDYVWIGAVNKRTNPTKRELSFAYTIQAKGRMVETYVDEARKSEIVRVTHSISDEKVVCNTAGYLYIDVLA